MAPDTCVHARGWARGQNLEFFKLLYFKFFHKLTAIGQKALIPGPKVTCRALLRNDPPEGTLAASCVPMRKQKNERRYFLQAGQCAVLSSFRVAKCCFCGKKGYVFYNFSKIL